MKWMTPMSLKKMTLRQAIDQPKLRSVRDRLRMYREHSSSRVLPEEYRQLLSQLKREAANNNDPMTAKAVWCLETIDRIQGHFLSAFSHIRSEACIAAWTDLESCEIQISFLDLHFTENSREFGIEHARAHTKQLQELYLMEYGISPGFLKQEVRCSICDTRLTLRSRCSHQKGEIYDGQKCGRIVKKMEFLHSVLVKNPAQKFSVVFPNGNDDLRLHLVKFLGQTLSSPWDSWSYNKETRKEFHPLFKDLDGSDPCPCDSGQEYKRCCFGKEERFPHFQFNFEGQTLIEPPSLEVHKLN